MKNPSPVARGGRAHGRVEAAVRYVTTRVMVEKRMKQLFCLIRRLIASQGGLVDSMRMRRCAGCLGRARHWPLLAGEFAGRGGDQIADPDQLAPLRSRSR